MKSFLEMTAAEKLRACANVLDTAAENFLNNGLTDGCEDTCNYTCNYSCSAIIEAVSRKYKFYSGCNPLELRVRDWPKNKAEDIRNAKAMLKMIRDGQRKMGLDVGSSKCYHDVDDEVTVQAMRYSWLKFCALIAREQAKQASQT